MDSIITQVRKEDVPASRAHSNIPRFPTDGRFAEKPEQNVKIIPASSAARGPTPESNHRLTKSNKSRSAARSPNSPRSERGGGFRSLLCCFYGGSGRSRSKAPVLGADVNAGDVIKLQTRQQSGPGTVTTDGKQATNAQTKNGAPVDTSQVQPMLPVQPTHPEDHVDLLPPVLPADFDKNCLIVDLDETLVHSSFKPVDNPDFVVPVELDGIEHQVYVLKRPHVDDFLARVGRLFECVLFTASLAKYADPVADLLDPQRQVFRARLFREACVFHEGSYVKDLGMLGRSLKRCIIVDNSPASFAFHVENAIPVVSWFDDPHDAELFNLMPFLERLSRVENVYTLLSMLRRQQSPSPPPSSEGSMENLNC